MSLEANKIAAAVLVGGLLTLSVGIATHMIYGTPSGSAVAAAGEAAEGAAGAAASVEAAAPVDIMPLIAAADPAAGEKAFNKCKSCHTVAKDGKNGVGPNLWGIVGNHNAHMEGFAYSDAIKNLGITWDYDHLNQFLTSPKGYAPGTKMTFAGIKKPEERAALIRWLRDQADAPVALPQ